MFLTDGWNVWLNLFNDLLSYGVLGKSQFNLAKKDQEPHKYTRVIPPTPSQVRVGRGGGAVY
jgi:hypothetical protein